MNWYAVIVVFFDGLLIGNCMGLPDWLVEDIRIPTSISRTKTGLLQLSNGIISRTFSTTPDFATIDFYSHEKQSSLLRAISPEAVISLDGMVYNIGGLGTDIPRAYMNRTALAEDVHQDNRSFHYVSHQAHTPQAPFPYKPRRGAPKTIVWPPKGLRLDVTFEAPFWAPVHHKSVSVIVHYEMYDGIPLMTKWVTVKAPKGTKENIRVGVHTVEYLAVNWQWSNAGYKWLYVQTDRAHSTQVAWSRDPSQSKMPGSFEEIVNCSYSLVPFLDLNEDFVSFRAMDLLIGSSDQERVGLSRRKMLRLLAPHTQENPIFFHMIHTDSTSVRSIIDQMAEVGFEMLIFSFGSKFNYESDNETYIASIAKDVVYAKSKNIEVAGYDLISLTRQVKPEWMAQNNETQSACFASGWYDYLLKRILNFMDKTGMIGIESDGPYGGYTCSSTNHSHHKGYQDSVYQQDQYQGRFYTLLRERAVYINQPDNYFYQGGSKTGMGYNENQYSLPRWQDLSISRQGMFDDTFHYTPTVGWMFLPIVPYHAGGKAAEFEPLRTHLKSYEWGLAQYMGAGVAACYRGYRLYDTPETKTLVKKWVSFYKQYRDIITSDIIHVRRADMQSIDCFMHVNPVLKNKALAMVFNPTQAIQTMNLTLPLYYTGLQKIAMVSQEGDKAVTYQLDRRYNIDVNVKLGPLGITWYLIKGQ